MLSAARKVVSSRPLVRSLVNRTPTRAIVNTLYQHGPATTFQQRPYSNQDASATSEKVKRERNESKEKETIKGFTMLTFVDACLLGNHCQAPLQHWLAQRSRTVPPALLLGRVPKVCCDQGWRCCPD
jgi:hypothetical protein